MTIPQTASADEASPQAPRRPGTSDPRDKMGFAVQEIGAGTIDAASFHDAVRHAPNRKGQRHIVVSDDAASDQDADRGITREIRTDR